MTSFRVKGRIFVTARSSGSCIHVFVPEEVREPAIAMHSEYMSKLLWAGKVVGLRVELPGAASGIVRDLVEKAWKSKAPKGRAVARASVGRKDAGS